MENVAAFAHRYKIRLDTMRDCTEFVAAVSRCKGKVYIMDENDEYRVDSKSQLGVMMAQAEWENLYVVSNEEIAGLIGKFII